MLLVKRRDQAYVIVAGSASKFRTLLSTTMSELDADLYGGEFFYPYIAYEGSLPMNDVYRPLWQR